MKTEIYLDNAATTFPKPESVYLKMDEVNRRLAVNAGRGSYALAQEATALIDETRTKLLNMVHGILVAEVVLSASATVACNQIIGGISWNCEDTVYVSPFEHNAVMRPLHQMHKKYGFQIEELPYDEDMNELDMKKLRYLFEQKRPKAVFATQVSNVTGYILPIIEICQAAKEKHAITIVDASQSLGLIDMDLSKQHIDYLIFAGHKNLYGPLGIGGFFKLDGLKLDTYLAGGTGSDSLNLDMPESGLQRYEAASPNIISIAGLHAAVESLEAEGGVSANYRHEKELSDYLAEELVKISGIRLYMPQIENHIGIVPFNIKGYQAADVGMLLDEDYGIAVRTGYHCAPLIHKYLKDEPYTGVVRASVGKYTTKEDILRLVEAVEEIAEG